MKIWLILSILPLLALDALENSFLEGSTHLDALLDDFEKDLAAGGKPNAEQSLRKAASATSYSQTVVTWGASSTSCAAPVTSVTISCAAGGKISIAPGQNGVASCTPISSNTLKCTKQPTVTSPYVSVKCTGKYTVTAKVPSYKYTNCKNTVKNNNAYQMINMAQVCAVKGNPTKFVGVYSKMCTPAMSLYPASSKNNPYCASQSLLCVNTTTIICTIATGALTISTPTTIDPLCILG